METKEDDDKINELTSTNTDEIDEIEMITQIHVPEDGGWGWVVVVTSFISIGLLDGVIYTFGSMFGDIKQDLKESESLIALINSVAFSMYFMISPIASAIINKFGFRECTMAGAVICSISLLCTYFARGYLLVILFYGVCNGIGACLINMATSLVAGFYFDKLRSVVLSICAAGSSVGCMIMYSVNSYLVRKAGWRNVTLLHSGMIAFIYFLGMTYKPLFPLFMKTTIPESTYTELQSKSDAKSNQGMLKAASNPKFPSVANIVRLGQISTTQSELGSNMTRASNADKEMMKCTISAYSNTLTQRQIDKVQSVVSGDKEHKMEVKLDIEPGEKPGQSSSFFHWNKNAPDARPLYRDDVFYSGSATELGVYKETVTSKSKDRFPIEYHMAVTRVASAGDMQEKNKLFPKSMRRVLATMIDPLLLKRCSFLMLCISSLFIYMGLLIPYTFLEERNKLEGIAKEHCSRIISFLAFTNLVGRIIIGVLAYKISPVVLYVVSVSMSGIGTMALNFSFSVYYQYACAGVFGFFSASLVSMRSVIIVKLFGLENLTNGTGLALMFQGIGSLISTPLSSVLKSKFGYAASFYTAGTFLITSGLIMTVIQDVARREKGRHFKRNGKVYAM